jgi:ribonucleoside-diphosphate reductase beta chain
VTERRSIEHGRRTGFATLQRGGLNFDSLPMRLFTKGNARHWNPADIDFTQDARDVAAMTEHERWWTCSLATQFMAGEESVTQDLQPFVAAMAAEGRIADEMYLTQFAFEETRHTEAFRRWLDAVGLTDDLHHHVENNPGYRAIFYEALPEALRSLDGDPSPANQVRASVTYNHVVEGTLALTGYYVWNRICTEQNIFPGMREIIRRIGDDERRHMAWGTFTCRRHVAADEKNWQLVQDRMAELLPHAITQITWAREQSGDDSAFAIPTEDLIAYATNRAGRRLGAIEAALGASVTLIDVDASPEELEETFSAEDDAALS